jgi:hypothetical protein
MISWVSSNSIVNITSAYMYVYVAPFENQTMRLMRIHVPWKLPHCRLKMLAIQGLNIYRLKLCNVPKYWTIRLFLIFRYFNVIRKETNMTLYMNFTLISCLQFSIFWCAFDTFEFPKLLLLQSSILWIFLKEYIFIFCVKVTGCDWDW